MNENLNAILLAASGAAKVPAKIQRKYFEKLYATIQKYADTFELFLGEDYLLDDSLRGSVQAFMEWLAVYCDTIICKNDDEVVGIAVFYGMVPERSIQIMAWVAPEYRSPNHSGQKIVKAFAEENILPHAWDLGVAKINAACAVENTGCIAFMENCGFRNIGISRLALQFSGQLSDSVLYELINPAYRVLDEEVEEDEDGRERANDIQPIDNELDTESFEPSDEPAISVPDPDPIRRRPISADAGISADGAAIAKLFAAKRK